MEKWLKMIGLARTICWKNNCEREREKKKKTKYTPKNWNKWDSYGIIVVCKHRLPIAEAHICFRIVCLLFMVRNIWDAHVTDRPTVRPSLHGSSVMLRYMNCECSNNNTKQLKLKHKQVNPHIKYSTKILCISVRWTKTKNQTKTNQNKCKVVAKR